MTIKLIKGNLKGNIQKTIISIIGICISVMLIFVAVNTYVSFQKMRLENAYDAYGEYNLLLHEVDRGTYDWIRSRSDRYTHVGVEKIIGMTDSQIGIVESGKNATEMNGYRLVDGTFPEQAGEVAISATAIIGEEFIIGNYNVGDSIELNGRKYSITGILDDYDYSTAETYKVALTKSETETGRYNIYLHCAGKREYQRALKEIRQYLQLDESSILHGDKEEGFLSGYTLIINEELNIVELEGKGGLDDINIGRLLLFFAVILVLTSVILSLHLFTSYLHGRNKQQGILLSLGFSNQYISCIYFMECLLLVVLGCLLGILFGRYLTVFLFERIQSMRTSRLEHFEPQFTQQSYMLATAVSFAGFLCGLVPVLVRTMDAHINEMIKTRRKKYRGTAAGTKNHGHKFITMKYFHRDSYPFEKFCIYMSMVMIGISVMLLVYVNKYVNYTVSHREYYDTEFDLISDDVSGMDGFEKLIPGVTYYDMVYDTMGVFHVGKDNINENCKEWIMYKEDDSVYCEIVGVSEQQYNNKIESESRMTYEEFVDAGGAIVIDNYLTGDERILKELPETLKYDGRQDYEFGIVYEPGEVKIIGRGKFKNWNDQMGISIIVPDKMFQEKFDYTNVLIKINVEDGYEIEAAEMLHQCSFKYNYSFHDHVTEYIKEQDNNMTIHAYTYGVLLFVTVMNLFIIVYVNGLVYVRRRRNLSVLKILGHSDMSIMLPLILEALAESIVAAILSVFISKVASKRLLPPVTQSVILTGGAQSILYVLLFLLVMQAIAVVVIFMRVRKQRIIYDLRES
ncbi:MAG: FtsX-like permease family protein [Clostridium sp.]|nr:FtsX-like permease family protein [Clostridium sp.]MCM1459300.1 FtsX-like permease family protein [Bacteroides sp.]